MNKPKDRPYVICHMQASIDGRISGEFFFTPAAEAVYERDNDIRKGYRADAVMNGSVTCAEIYADGILRSRPQTPDCVDAGACPDSVREDFAAEHTLSSYIVCVDPRGSLKWNGNSVSHRGAPPAHIIEVLTEDIGDGYPAYLRDLGISYIFAGESGLDLPLALRKLKSIFGIERVLLTGGGQMNWTFLQAGCIDELNIVILPMVDGNTASAGLFDRPASGTEGSAFAPSGFKLADVQRLPGDALRLTYTPV